MNLEHIIEDIVAVADKRIAEERQADTREYLEQASREIRSIADALERLAPAESMYLCSIAHKLEMKARRLPKK